MASGFTGGVDNSGNQQVLVDLLKSSKKQDEDINKISPSPTATDSPTSTKEAKDIKTANISGVSLLDKSANALDKSTNLQEKQQQASSGFFPELKTAFLEILGITPAKQDTDKESKSVGGISTPIEAPKEKSEVKKESDIFKPAEGSLSKGSKDETDKKLTEPISNKSPDQLIALSNQAIQTASKPQQNNIA